MNRPILVCALLLLAAASLGAQKTTESNPYEGVSAPPPNDTIVTTSTPQAKPPAGRPAAAPVPAATPFQQQAPPQPLQPQGMSVYPAANTPDSATYADPDGDIVTVQQSAPAPRQPALTRRDYARDPDGDIVHPRPLPPGELPEGTTIRVRLLSWLSTASSEKGEEFRSRVAADVLRGNQLLIPVGSEIDGRLTEVSSGHLGGHGTMRLWPETVILPGGERYQLSAQLTGTPGSRAQVGGEGTVRPASRMKRDSIEYGGTVGVGVVTGAILGGPVGALAGSLVGAGVVTTHLLVSHPQATLEPGATLLFSLTQPLNLVPASASGREALGENTPARGADF
jgi:hypothetical protein